MYPVQHTAPLGEDLKVGASVVLDPITGCFVKACKPVPEDTFVAVLLRSGYAGDVSTAAVTTAEYINSR